MAPGQGPVKIAAALAIAAAGLGGGFAYKKFRIYLSEKGCVRNANNHDGGKRNKKPRPSPVSGA